MRFALKFLEGEVVGALPNVDQTVDAGAAVPGQQKLAKQWRPTTIREVRHDGPE